MIAGTSNVCCGVGVVTISMNKGDSAKVYVLAAHGKLLGFDLLLGIDVIKALGVVAEPTGAAQIDNGKVCAQQFPSMNLI